MSQVVSSISPKIVSGFTFDESSLKALDAFFLLFDNVIGKRDQTITTTLERRFVRLHKFLSFCTDENDTQGKAYLYMRFNKDIGRALKMIFEYSLEVFKNKNNAKVHDKFADREIYYDFKEGSPARMFIILKTISLKYAEQIQNEKLNKKILKQSCIILEPAICKIRFETKVQKSAKDVNFAIARGCAILQKFAWSTFLEKIELKNATLYLHKYLAGGDLYRIAYEDEDLFQWKDLRLIVKRMLTQLRDFHSNNIIFGDSKFENYLWDKSSKKGLFGAWTDTEYSGTKARINKVWGSPGSYPPEVIINSGRPKIEWVLDMRSDIYSTGIMIALLLKQDIDESVIEWVKEFRELQIDQKLQKAMQVACDIDRYNRLVKEAKTGTTKFVLPLLHPYYTHRSYIAKAIKCFDELVPQELVYS